MNDCSFHSLLSRRRLLTATSALAFAALVATANATPALAEDGAQDGGDVVFLIESLGDPWSP